MHLEVKEVEVPGSKREGHQRIAHLPALLQLVAVKSLLIDAAKEGPGHNYLVQHSAGSGKSNSIA